MFYKLAVITLYLSVSGAATAQVLHFPDNQTNDLGNTMVLDAIQTTEMDFNFFTINSPNANNTPLEGPGGAVSKLDLKAPSKARREFEKGYQLLWRKDFPGAIEHLGQSLAIYPNFVAAHNALGTAYLDTNKSQEAKGEFAKAVSLDEHLPNSYLNLGCAQLALKDYPGAEQSFDKASSIAPLDVPLLMAKTYGEFVNKDYPAVVTTAKIVHARKHTGAEVVHYFAAGAWEAQGNLDEAQREIEVLLKEDPKSGSADQFRQTLAEIKTERTRRAEAKLHPATEQKVTFALSDSAPKSSEEATRQAQQMLQDIKEKNEIAEAEAAEPDGSCASCDTATASMSATSVGSSSGAIRRAKVKGPVVFRSAVDEVAIFFAATDHGRSVTDLTPQQVGVRDDSRPPEAIHSFRNESQLPLRLGLIIDTSNSVTGRFSFEQAAAAKFLEKVVTNKDDLTFVVGVNNSVLLVQDFTGDQTLTAHAVNQLAPGGGTAMWDAIEFGANKLASRAETQPVARILVVISDGEDNSSNTSLKDAIATAQKGEVAIYTVSTRDAIQEESSALIGDHALKTMAELTGGASFVPGSVRHLNGSLNDLQQVIRGRYLVSYKPAAFERDGRYRSIQIKAQKDGHTLRVYARKGYYASTAQPATAE